ncbi:DUF6155 family protein [Mucilaginibacter pedocola]|uniref:Uncharacterized protein n=1 Tax=Mucilaginibacter pedocola TaxID=1792845 RepID=A0A1S9PFL1_9SPHI|nr:DUF6155 family protein [Mucilaginibacter pedocola]OOQ59731.1 hypothetical protein BC343_06085 [Mucilaginibacter pedocola]
MNVKRELTNLDKKALVEILADLYKKNKQVQEYLGLYIKPEDEAGLLERYSAKVRESFYPKRGYTYSLKAGKDAIADFKKLGTSAESLISLMLLYVETGVEFTNDFGDINEAFYNSLASTFKNALKLARTEGILESFEKRAAHILQQSQNIGWGFEYDVLDIFFDHYE